MLRCSNDWIGACALAACASAMIFAESAAGSPAAVIESASAHVHLFDPITPHDRDQTSPVNTGSGSLDLTGPSQETSAMQWDVHNDDSLTEMDFSFQAFGGFGGQGDGDATVHFQTNEQASYRLVMNFPAVYGNRSNGSVDGQEIGFSSNILNPDEPGVKQLSGVLAAGDHVFSASTLAGQGRSTPMRSDGSITLSVSTIPLPAAVAPGAAVLGLLAVSHWRQRRQPCP